MYLDIQVTYTIIVIICFVLLSYDVSYRCLDDEVKMRLTVTVAEAGVDEHASEQ